MPQVAVAVAAAAAASAAQAAAAAFVAGWVAAVAGAIAGAIVSYAGAMIFAKKPKSSGLADVGGHSQMIKQAITSRRIVYGETIVSGPITYLAVTGNKRYLHILITLAGHPVEEIGDVYFGDKVVLSGGGYGDLQGEYQGFGWLWKGNGTDAGDADLLAAMRGYHPEWSLNHRQKGCAKLYVRLTWDSKIYAGGIPQIKCMVKGKNDILDPRTGVRGYSNNWGLCVADYITISLGVDAARDDVDDDDLIASANISDEDIPLADGGTEKRYVVNGVIDTDNPVGDNLKELINPGAGLVVNAGGKWKILAGAYRTPTVAIDESWLTGAISVQARQSKRDTFNVVRGVYASAGTLWQPTDLPVLKSQVFIEEDGGQEIAVDREFLFTDSVSAGQRLQKIALLKNRQQVQVDLKCNLFAFQVTVGDVVKFNRASWGWVDKPFEVIRWNLAVRDDGDVPYFGVDLTLRETSPQTYDWDVAEEVIVAANAASSLPGMGDVEPPDGLDVSEVLYSTRDGSGVKAKAVLTAGVSPDAMVTSYQFSYRELGVLEWTDLPISISSVVEVFDFAPGVYDFRVYAVNRLGAASDAAQIRKEIYGLSAAPSAPSGLTISTTGGYALLRWERSPDLDVRQGGKCRFRWSPAVSDPVVSQSSSIGDALAGSDTMAVLPLKPGCYLLQFIDSSGNVSDFAWVATEGATILPFGNVGEVSEAPFWAGAFNDTGVVEGRLRIAGAGVFDDIPDFDGVSSIDAFGGVLSYGSYRFGAGFDFGGLARRRLIALLTMNVVSAIDNIDQRTGLVDDWASWDAVVTAEGDASVWYRTTNDDPAGESPAWSSWHRLDSAEVYCRGVEFEARLSVSDRSYNVEISDLRVRADALA
ncbi:hypothetical protein [Thalassospira sp.]|uniref:hypothetical protein n=1 Tax=Thalassospira sp. TaxID=1912094 RepID=UPI003AA9C259